MFSKLSESAREPAAAHDVFRAQAPIQRHSGGTPGDVYFAGCLIYGTPVVNGLRLTLIIMLLTKLITIESKIIIVMIMKISENSKQVR